MSRQRLFGTLSVVLSAFTVWIYIVTQMQPDKNDFLLLTTFFLSLFVWVGSALAGLFYYWRLKRSKREVIYAHAKPSIRQGFLIAGTLCILLFLQLFKVISVWDTILVISMAIVFEIAAQQGQVVRK